MFKKCILTVKNCPPKYNKNLSMMLKFLFFPHSLNNGKIEIINHINSQDFEVDLKKHFKPLDIYGIESEMNFLK